MKISKIKEMSSPELEKELVELKNELFKLRFSLATNGLDNPIKIKEVKKEIPEAIIFADVSNLEEARRAVENGADIVAPTLYGYTKETSHIEGADYRMFAQMCRELKDEAYVMMEGHLYTPEDAMKCIFLGAHSVVVGSAITRPHLTAKRFVDLLSGYQDNWRDAEKAKH